MSASSSSHFDNRLKRWTKPISVYVALLAVVLNLFAFLHAPQVSAAVPTAAGMNPAPDVMPSLREWKGGIGDFKIGPQSRIMVDQNYEQQLNDDAEVFLDDLKALPAPNVPIVIGKKPKQGDLFVTLDPSVTWDEGYMLDISDSVVIKGKTDRGVFYGLQSVLQILKQDDAHDTLPHGSAIDYPDIKLRSFMVDSGHTFAKQEYVEGIIRQIAWQKMNTLHLHLTDGWLTDGGGFRLNSDKYPGLADKNASYTKEQIRHMEELAKKYHITIIPEIDVPAHAGIMANYNPALKWTCAGLQGNWGTLDITKPANRQWVKDLLSEFITWFDGPVFHIGTDEYITQQAQESCSEIVQYRDDHGFNSTADVFVDFINEMNEVVKSYGKRTMIWNWWDIEQNPTLSPSKDIIVEAWRGDPQKYTDQGYDVVNSDEVILYTGPTDPPGYPTDSNRVYKEWNMPTNPKILGFSLSTWTGGFASSSRPEPSDDYFEWFSRRPREALAERAWGGPLSDTTAAFEDRVDRIGTAPGLSEYAPYGGVKLIGEPYGSSPSYDSASSYDKAFDGNPSTNFDYVSPNDGYTGIDLGVGNAKPVNKIRFLPRLNYTSRMIGGKLQGSNEGPDKGFVDLYTINWWPDNGWMEVPVKDTAAYRWLRYISPDNGYANVAEVEFYTAEPNGNQSANTVIQAGQFSKKKGGIRVEKGGSLDAASIGHISSGDWVRYNNVDFSESSYDTFMAKIALGSSTGQNAIEIRLDAPDGRLIGSLKPQSTGSNQAFEERYTSVAYVSGIHHVYLVFPSDTDLRLSWFVFGSDADKEDAEAKQRRIQWFTNARFGGIFRFGAYSQLAGTYNGQTQDNAEGAFIMNWAHMSKDQYLAAAAKPFNPSSFNAKAWVQSAKASGEKYMIAVAKDRDGFSMYDTKVKDFRDFAVMTTSAFGRTASNKDPLAQLAEESKQSGLKFGVYYSISDWYHHSQMMKEDGSTTMSPGQKELYVSEMKEQLRELIENYSPDLIWFDGTDSVWWTPEDAKSLYKYVRTLKSGIIVSSGIGSGYGDFNTEPEKNSLSVDPKENRAPMNGSYGYVSYDHNWKTVSDVVYSLIDSASDGRNFMLGTGPVPNGTLPQESSQLMNQVGVWMSVYGDSIYNTRANIFPKALDWGVATASRGKLYLHVTKWPANGQLTVPAILNNIKRVYLMNNPSNGLAYQTNGAKTVIDVPGLVPNPFDSVIVMEVDGQPEAMPGVLLQGTVYGTTPSYDPNSTYDKVFDGKTNTYFDYLGPKGGYAGIDLGEGNAKNVSFIRYYPRVAYEGRMLNGKFQGSNEGPNSGFVDLATVNAVPAPTWNALKVNNPGSYRWIRYLSPDYGYSNVAEIQFYGMDSGSDQ